MPYFVEGHEPELMHEAMASTLDTAVERIKKIQQEDGTITTPFDMTVLNELDRFHLVMDAIDRLPQTGEKGLYLKQQLKDKLIEHKQYIDKHGEDLPEIHNWRWGDPK